jgi:hypothetical protein
LNPVNVSGGGSTITNGNLSTTAGDSGSYAKVLGTFGMTTGKWYWEVTSIAVGTYSIIGISDGSPANSSYALGGVTGEIAYLNNGNKYANGSSTAYGASYTTNDIIGVAYDADAGSITFYKNGTSQGAVTGFSGTKYPAVGGYSPTNPQYALNFGQRPFAYTPPTGFVALNTFNLPTPTIGATASTTANKYFDATLYNGNSSTQTINNASGFYPDFNWIKSRSGAGSHVLANSVVGGTKQLFSNLTNAEQTDTRITNGISSSGIALGDNSGGTGNTNISGSTYVAWQWQAGQGSSSSNTQGTITSTVSANTTAGFSIVTYTGNATSGATVGHGLGVAPSMIILKSRTVATNWYVYHSGLTSAAYQVYLNLTAAQDNAVTTAFNNTAPGATTFTLPGTGFGSNNSGATYVAYCFAPVAGYSAFGSYTGNGSSDGTFVYTGFRPAFLLIKRTDSAGGWYTYDDVRSTYNLNATILQPNLSDAEFIGTNNSYDFLSNGFKNRGTGGDNNASGGTYIYMAFAENPIKNALAR